MPIQIRELHIKVVVNAAESPPSSTSADAQQQTAAGGGSDTDKDLIISECVEQVMSILREKTEK
ncbi:hypothetical protein EGT74_24030 [Chitinophaga lutea]|uniref:Uncharacterized protein n=1 Tax=Chitinophaga lutea TaxID=2488634 RepID=A0A3N4PDG5_9BACT|nr:DUF5908 family protein [Chitinophaga lutea]RPE05458.1 hypothetical protein EGT74_24030 [Chitinophaga lutea]